MISKNRPKNRDEVLFAFHEACERPTAEQIVEWTEKYPEFADDIREHAELLLSWLTRNEHSAEEPDEAMISRGWSRTLNAIYKAEKEAETAPEVKSVENFSQLLEARAMTIPALARQLDIDRLVVGELNAGRMKPPIGNRLTAALAEALEISSKHLAAAIQQSFASPAMGHAKAGQTPTVVAQTYDEVVLSSSMSEEKKLYWLGKDSQWTPGATSE